MRAGTRIVVAVLCALFVAVAVHAADEPFLVEPTDPTSRERVTLIVTQFDSCPPPPIVTRDGFSIHVDVIYGMCLSPPVEITHRLDLGVLPAGTYSVTISRGSETSTGSFVVLDANNSVVVRPAIGSTAGGSRVQIVADVYCPAGAACPDATVTFGGVAATDVVVTTWKTLMATVPPHAAGAVEVRVTRTATKSSYAFRYYDPAAAPLDAGFERVLIPVIYNGAGANGSQWQTEVSVRNTSPVPIDFWREQGVVQKIPALASLTESLGESPAGRFLFVPRDVAANLHFGALVRDASREEREWGTELPVAHESDFATDVDLLNIPVDARFRHKLRIYSLGSIDGWATVTVYLMNDGSIIRRRDVKLTSSVPCYIPGPCASAFPSFIQIDDLLTGLNTLGRHIGIQVNSWYGGNPRLWAFVTVTNNETQHVTMISPH